MAWRRFVRLAAVVLGLAMAMAVSAVSAVAAPPPVLDHMSVLGWGQNSDAQLGDGTTDTPDFPVHAVGLANGMNHVDGGYLHGLALDRDGQVWSWGRNEQGQLGLGDTDSAHHTVPEKVVELAGIHDISAGQFHNLAARNDGAVWAWGLNDYGQLGDGTTDLAATPVAVPGLTDIVQVSAGAGHSLALGADGTVWSWGDNTHGQLGIGSDSGEQRSPEQIAGLDSVIQISAGALHSLALRADGTVWAWGFGANGQLGTGSRDDEFVPAMSTIDMVTQIAAGGFHSLALRDNGVVHAWGSNRFSQLGDGTTVDDRLRPVPVVGLSLGEAGIKQIDAGYTHSLVLSNDGYVWTWGIHVTSQGTATFEFAWPVPGPSKVAYVAGGWLFTLIVREDPPVACPDPDKC